MANVHVKVDQTDGEITIAGTIDHTYRVTDGHASVAEADVARFLAAVPGSSVSGGSPSGPTKEK